MNRNIAIINLYSLFKLFHKKVKFHVLKIKIIWVKSFTILIKRNETKTRKSKPFISIPYISDSKDEMTAEIAFKRVRDILIDDLKVKNYTLY